MSPYEELVKRCRKEAHSISWRTCELVLAEVFRTLETVRPEMYAAALEAMVSNHDAYAAWRSMLRASPIAPPKTDP